MALQGEVRMRNSVVLGLLLITTAMVWFLARDARESERTLRVEVVCEGDRCRGSINGRSPLEWTIPVGPGKSRVGLYAFQKSEDAPAPHFRQLDLAGSSRHICCRSY